jgi:DNA-binding GntR family transcriptional regulator
MEKLQIISVKEQVVEALKKDIISGFFKPCQPLYERDLAERLGVSRTPIREALQVLVTTGFVETKSRIGWSVSMPDAKSIEEILELRLILELTGAEIILAGNHDPLREDISTLFDHFTDAKIASDMEEYLKTDRRFHKSLVEVTNNARIMEIYGNLALWIDWVRSFVSYKSPRSRSLKEHLAICDGLRKKDLKATQDALRAHIKRVGNEFKFQLDRISQEKSAAVSK